MRTKRFLILVIFLAMFASISLTSTKDVKAGNETAYQVGVAFYSPWYNPHYGAFFAGSNGRNQYFTGSSGQPSGYTSWNWWGSSSSVLLLEKTWLFAYSCIYAGQPSICFDRHDKQYHHAWLDCPC